jgi:N-acetylmuramoyl-L-alanine amidase
MGMLAVAQVVENRVSSPNYPNSVCEVVQEPHQFAWKGGMPSDEAYGAALAYWLLEWDIVGDAKWFHSVNVKPYWATTEYIQLGNHRFYNAVCTKKRCSL